MWRCLYERENFADVKKFPEVEGVGVDFFNLEERTDEGCIAFLTRSPSINLYKFCRFLEDEYEKLGSTVSCGTSPNLGDKEYTVYLEKGVDWQ